MNHNNFRMRFEVGAIIRATSYKQTAKPAIQITKQFLSKSFLKLIGLPRKRFHPMYRAGPLMVAIIFMRGTKYDCNDNYFED